MSLFLIKSWLFDQNKIIFFFEACSFYFCTITGSKPQKGIRIEIRGKW